jgi:hypothetical protein
VSAQSKSQHILELSKELLDDIELSRLDAEKLILKASRLARLEGSDEVRAWLRFEMSGYNSADPLSIKYMGITGRWTDYEKKEGYWGPLSQQEATIEAHKRQLASMRTPDAGGNYASVAIRQVTQSMSSITGVIARLSGIRSKVLGRLHVFVTEVYYEKQFESLAESIFEQWQGGVDLLIAAHCGAVLEKIPSVMSRLSEGDPEAVSQALTTCRRIIESFADSIFPPSEETMELGGNQVTLGASKYQNRINAYVALRTTSASRRQRIRQNLSNLYDRLSTGVHSDVSAAEAQSLFLNTYLLLGEVLQLQSSAS